MIKEITKLVISVLIIAGTIYAVIQNLSAIPYLTGLSGVVIGYYFGDLSSGQSRLVAAFKKQV